MAGAAVELIRYNAETRRFEVGQEAIDVLRRTPTPVGVVAVCGRARQVGWDVFRTWASHLSGALLSCLGSRARLSAAKPAPFDGGGGASTRSPVVDHRETPRRRASSACASAGQVLHPQPAAVSDGGLPDRQHAPPLHQGAVDVVDAAGAHRRGRQPIPPGKLLHCPFGQHLHAVASHHIAA